MTKELLKTSLPASVMTTDPMTIEELDNHPDSDKIWVTLKSVQEEAYKVGYWDGYADSKEE